MNGDNSIDFSAEQIPLISIVVPIYNGMPFLTATITSVRHQSFGDWELILCDNASTDGTVPCVQKQLKDHPDPRIRLIEHESHLPMAENWNRSLAYARGDFVKLLPSDDILLPACLEIQAGLLRSNPDAGFVTSGKEIIDSNGRTLFVRRPLRAGKYNWQRLGCRALRAVVNILGEPAGILFRRHLLETCGNYDSAYRYFIDVELLLRFLKQTNLITHGDPLYQFRIHGNSISASSRKMAFTEYLHLIDKYKLDLGFSIKPLLRSYLKMKARLVTTLRAFIFSLNRKSPIRASK